MDSLRLGNAYPPVISAPGHHGMALVVSALVLLGRARLNLRETAIFRSVPKADLIHYVEPPLLDETPLFARVVGAQNIPSVDVKSV